MNILILSRPKLPISVSSYINCVRSTLEEMGVKFEEEDAKNTYKLKYDLVWIPYLSGGAPPPRCIKGLTGPVVVTLHGAAPHTVPFGEYFHGVKSKLFGSLVIARNLFYWRIRSKYCSKIITVSSYARTEIMQVFNLPFESIEPIYHGVDHNVFKEETRQLTEAPYFLHVSSWQPKKNLQFIVDAYSNLRKIIGGCNCPDLRLITPGMELKYEMPGVIHSLSPVNSEELSILYRGALAFVFPSKHESFGMPLVEAMASGCVVITSKTTACGEVVGDAGLLVDPYDLDSLIEAMGLIVRSPEKLTELRKKSIDRAKEFSWRDCSEKHYDVFSEVVSNHLNNGSVNSQF